MLNVYWLIIICLRLGEKLQGPLDGSRQHGAFPANNSGREVLTSGETVWLPASLLQNILQTA